MFIIIEYHNFKWMIKLGFAMFEALIIKNKIYDRFIFLIVIN